MLTYVALVHTHMPRHVLGWVGWGGDVNVRCTCTHAHATSRLGLGGVGMLTYVALVHTHMPRHVLGWEGWVRFPSAGIILIRCFAYCCISFYCMTNQR